MQVQITNNQIFFAIENCWQSLDYRFKAHLNSVVKENESPDFLQTIEIDKKSFVQVMNAVNSQPQGIAKEINPLMYDALKLQVLTLASQGNAEAIEIAQEMAAILESNATMLANKILNGKTQILEP